METGEKDDKDSVYLLFNQAIQIKSIKSNWESCVSEIEYNLTDNNQGVMFSYPCAELGGNYPFTISVTDTEGNVFTQNINVPFYKTKIDFDGFMTDFLLLNNDKEILISTFYPSRLIRYSIESDAIVRTYDLSEYISPMKLSYNPYNSKVYFMGSDPLTDWRMAYINRPDVYSVDLETGQINKAFTVKPDEFDHPQYPANIPYNIGFTKSGGGIVLLRSNESSELRWKLIDCTNNDSIYTYPFYDSNIDEYTDFDNVHMNYDHTKLYLTQPYGSCHYGIFDETTKHMSILTPSSLTRGVSITANRESDKFYAHQLYDQFIIDMYGNMSEITYLNDYFGGSDDFSYRENDSNIIYFNVEISAVGHPNGFYILDYNIGSIIMSCDIIDYLQKFTSTIDGKYAITYKQNSDISSSVYIFETKYFHRTLK